MSVHHRAMTPTEVRLPLYRDGFHPLPLNGKSPSLPNPSLRAQSRGWAMTAPPFTVTFFDHRSARFKREVQVTLPELREMIEAQTAERKDLLPWIKFAVF